MNLAFSSCSHPLPQWTIDSLNEAMPPSILGTALAVLRAKLWSRNCVGAPDLPLIYSLTLSTLNLVGLSSL